MINRLFTIKNYKNNKSLNLIKSCYNIRSNNYCTTSSSNNNSTIFSTKNSKDAEKGTIRSEQDIKNEIELFQQNIIPKQDKKEPTDFTSLKLNHDIRVAMEKAYDEFTSGKYEDALKRYYWVLAKTPYDCAVRLQRASALEHLSRLDDAITDCNLVIKISQDGEILSEAFVIKGVCLMRQEKYNESIVAFEKSLLLIPNSKVLDLKRQAELMLYPDSVIVPTHEDDYSFFNDVSASLMDNAIVKKSNIHGRGIFATRDIEEEELLFEVPSLISIPTDLVKNKIDKHDDGHCYNCHLSFKPLELDNEKEISKSREFHKIQDTLHRMTNLPFGEISGTCCPKCNEAIFCSSECEEQGMAKHQLICKGTASNAYNNFLTKFYHECSKLDVEEKTCYLLMLQLFSLQYNTGGDPDEPLRAMQLDSFVKRLVYAEPSKNQSHYLSRRDQKMYQLMKGIFSNREITPQMYQRVKSIVQLNNLVYPTSKIRILSQPNPMDELGYSFDFQELPSQQLISILMQASFLNHSCEPNVFIATPVVNDKSIRFCSRRPIKKGEELFISYIEGNNVDTETRRNTLKTSHNFICNCQACCSKKIVKSLSLID